MLDFRLYEPCDMGGCLDLIHTGHDAHFSEERFRWLHERGPAGTSQIALCLRGHQIVGMYSVLPKPIQFGGRYFCGGRDIDPVVHPSCRGQGVFSRLLKFGLANFKGIDFLFNFANPASSVGFRRQGWRDVMKLEDRVRQMGFRRPFSRAGLLWGLGRMSRTSRDDFCIRLLDSEAFAELLSGNPRFAKPGKRLNRGGVVRSAKYLKWRYLDHPMHRYLYFLAENGSGGAGLAVCRYEKETDLLFVVDLADFGLWPNLCTWLPLWKEDYPTATVTVWHSLHPSILAGFIGNPASKGKGQPFLVREFLGGMAPKGYLEGGNWIITRGDLEIA